LGNYIPAGGYLRLDLPDDIKVDDSQSSPWSDYSSSQSKLTQKGYTESSITVKADAKIPSGDLTISFGGIQNPRSFQPTELFNASTFDGQDNVVGEG
jgi:hypothetical protein